MMQLMITMKSRLVVRIATAHHYTTWLWTTLLPRHHLDRRCAVQTEFHRYYNGTDGYFEKVYTISLMYFLTWEICEIKMNLYLPLKHVNLLLQFIRIDEDELDSCAPESVPQWICRREFILLLKVNQVYSNILFLPHSAKVLWSINALWEFNTGRFLTVVRG